MSDRKRELEWAQNVREKADVALSGAFEEVDLLELAQACVEMPFSLVSRLPMWTDLPEYLQKRIDKLRERVRGSADAGVGE